MKCDDCIFYTNKNGRSCESSTRITPGCTIQTHLKKYLYTRKCLCVKVHHLLCHLVHTEIQRAPSSLSLPHTHTLLSRPGACKQPTAARITHSPLSHTHSTARKNTHSYLQRSGLKIFLRAITAFICLDQIQVILRSNYFLLRLKTSFKFKSKIKT